MTLRLATSWEPRAKQIPTDLLTSLPLASRWIIPSGIRCHSVIQNFNFRVQYLIYALINFFSSSHSLFVSLSYSDWVFCYYTIPVIHVKISLKYGSISCFLLSLLHRHVWKEETFTFLERLDFLYHSVPMTGQVTSERIPTDNPTAKPKLNGLDVSLSVLSTAKKAPLCKIFSHILF